MLLNLLQINENYTGLKNGLLYVDIFSLNYKKRIKQMNTKIKNHSLNKSQFANVIKRSNDDSEKLLSIKRRIKGMFINIPEKVLMYKIIEFAIDDLIITSKRNIEIDRFNQNSAQRYIRSDLVHAEVCGVTRAWILRLFKDYNCMHLLGDE